METSKLLHLDVPVLGFQILVALAENVRTPNYIVPVKRITLIRQYLTPALFGPTGQS